MLYSSQPSLQIGLPRPAVPLVGGLRGGPRRGRLGHGADGPVRGLRQLQGRQEERRASQEPS